MTPAGALGAITVLVLTGLLASCGSDGVESRRPSVASIATTEPAPAAERPGPDDGPLTDEEATVGCRGLGLLAIGDLAADADADPELAEVAVRFSELASAEAVRPALVCAEPVERWRDVVISRLHTSARPDGVIITAASGDAPVLRLTKAEWETYKFRGGDDPGARNFVGPPVGRTTVAGTDVIRTTRGGVVMQRPDSFGAVVVESVWTFWYEQRGYEQVGLPTSAPTTADGIDGAYQDFTTAWGRLPGVSGADEAAAATGTDALVFTPVVDPVADRPPGAEGNILQTTGTSWFLDRDGVRHWLDSVESYQCAVRDEGAVELEVRGWVSASYPLGDPYVCDD